MPRCPPAPNACICLHPGFQHSHIKTAIAGRLTCTRLPAAVASPARVAVICKPVQDRLHQTRADHSVACVTPRASANEDTASAAGRDVTSPRFDPGFAHAARVYNVWLGGKDGLAADRKAA